MSVYAITTLILTAYERERHHNEVLMEKLRNLSTRDALSGLFNRRELFRRLEIVYNDHPAERSEKLSRDHQYIAMFDVDNFKHLNDTYGHSFGDTVLAAVAHVLDESADPKHGEMASRYGGEEFVCLLTASGLEEAVARVDGIRQKVALLRFEEVPDLVVTISGGVVPCNSEKDIKQVMHNVDELLYEAKREGKNRICSKMAQPALKQE
jgi:diguanylate cyclase (GGDEF)-like protein